MEKFVEICTLILPVALAWHILFIFFVPDSRCQLNRFRKVLDRLIEELNVQAEDGARYPELNIIYKNKKFSIGIIIKEVNYHYSTYTIFINGEEAGYYHRLKHLWKNSYYFEECNHRHRGEVESIIYACNKVLKQKSKTKKEKLDGYTEYSYFK